MFTQAQNKWSIAVQITPQKFKPSRKLIENLDLFTQLEPNRILDVQIPEIQESLELLSDGSVRATITCSIDGLVD